MSTDKKELKDKRKHASKDQKTHKSLSERLRRGRMSKILITVAQDHNRPAHLPTHPSVHPLPLYFPPSPLPTHLCHTPH